jgi:phage FluMu protein Com
MSDKFDESRKALGTECVDNFLAKFGMGPKYVPKKPQTCECPRCKRQNAFIKEIHPDTDINAIVLYCPDCKYEEER